MNEQFANRMSLVKSSIIRDILDVASRQTSQQMISFSGGVPAPELFPFERIDMVSHRLLVERDARSLQYGPTIGEASLRTLLSEIALARVDPDSVIITTGSQEGLDLIGRIFLERGDVVFVSDPEYVGAIQAFAPYEATLEPVTTESGEISIERVEASLRSGIRPRLMYVVPNFHNPTTRSVPIEIIGRLVQLAEEYGFFLCLDDPYRLLAFDGPEHVGKWTTLIENDCVVYLGSISKTLAPGLRVGWVSAVPEVISMLVRAKQGVDLHTSTYCQGIVSRLLADRDWFEAHLQLVRAYYAGKALELAELLLKELSDRIEFEMPTGGMFLWIKCLEPVDTLVALERCMNLGVGYVPGAAFSVKRDLSRYLRVSYATANSDEMRTGVTLLAKGLFQGS